MMQLPPFSAVFMSVNCQVELIHTCSAAAIKHTWPSSADQHNHITAPPRWPTSSVTSALCIRCCGAFCDSQSASHLVGSVAFFWLLSLVWFFRSCWFINSKSIRMCELGLALSHPVWFISGQKHERWLRQNEGRTLFDDVLPSPVAEVFQEGRVDPPLSCATSLSSPHRLLQTPASPVTWWHDSTSAVWFHR